MGDIIIHTFVEPALSEDHELAHQLVSCEVCGVLLHNDNNEHTELWLETGKGNYCLDCFYFDVTLRSDGIYIAQDLSKWAL